MKQSHKYETQEITRIYCPHCRKYFDRGGSDYDAGDIVRCDYCEKEFQLGDQW